MKRKFYFAAAALMMAASTVNAQQQVIETDTEFTDPASWGTHVSTVISSSPVPL